MDPSSTVLSESLVSHLHAQCYCWPFPKWIPQDCTDLKENAEAQPTHDGFNQLFQTHQVSFASLFEVPDPSSLQIGIGLCRNFTFCIFIIIVILWIYIWYDTSFDYCSQCFSILVFNSRNWCCIALGFHFLDFRLVG